MMYNILIIYKYYLIKFKEIEVSFSTHYAKGITENDIDVARDLEEIPL